MLGVLALVITGTCVWASFRRLKLALSPTVFDPQTMLWALGKGGPGREALEGAVSSLEESSWERGLFDALKAPASMRTGLVNEALGEFDQLAQRWARVPRVCMSVAWKSAFLLAAVALSAGLMAAEGGSDDELKGRLIATVVDAVNVGAVGIAGVAFCMAVHMRAKKAVKSHLEATDKLVQKLEGLS